MRCRFNSLLLLCVPLDGGLVQEVENTSDGSPSCQIMVWIGVFACGSDHGLAFRLRGIRCLALTDFSARSASPVTLVLGQVQAVWFVRSHADAGVAELG